MVIISKTVHFSGGVVSLQSVDLNGVIVGYTTYQDLVEYELLSAWKHLWYPTTVNASKSKVFKYGFKPDEVFLF